MSSEREISAWVYGCTDVGVVRRNNEDAFVIADLTTRAAAGSVVPPGADAPTLDPTERGHEGTAGQRRQGNLLGCRTTGGVARPAAQSWAARRRRSRLLARWVRIAARAASLSRLAMASRIEPCSALTRRR